MHGKILIVDPIATNRIVLKVKLASAYYSVIQASSIADAKLELEKSRPDVVISSAQLMDGTVTDLAIAIRKQPKAGDLPIIAIDSDYNQENRITFLSAGVDAVLNHPLNDTLLLARVRCLVRSHASDSEWQLRDDTSRALGFAEKQVTFLPSGRAVIVAREKSQILTWPLQMKDLLTARTAVAGLDDALAHVDNPESHVEPDVFVLVMDRIEPEKTLHLLATLKSHISTRHCAILIVQSTPNQMLGAQALDMGANDLMAHGFDPREMALKIDTLLKRKQTSDQMRATVRTGLEAAVCDPLTGLHNRRYAMPHLDRIARHAYKSNKPFAVMIADMDHFKQINDNYGHAAGDAVLVEMARRLRENLREIDLVARIGGEEFLIALPSAPLASARNAARRLCKLVGNTPFEIPGALHPITATISIGLAVGGSIEDGEKAAHQLLDEADKALYAAKMRGRNCVTLARPAA